MYSLFSVDDHIVEPANLWSSRLPLKYKDVGPRVVYDDGRQVWAYEDEKINYLGLNAVAGKPKALWNHEPVSFEDMIPGCYDPKARLNDFAKEGIVASLSFPTLPRFGGTRFAAFGDKVLADLCVKAWNDYVHEEWCAAAPDVYVPMSIVQLWDPEGAVQEIERNLDRGARAITLPEEPSNHGLPSYYDEFWDPIWKLCEDSNIPVCMHVGSSGWKVFTPPGSGELLTYALAQVPTIVHAAGMMFSPVPRKFPNIRIVYSEGGISWIPSTLERLDRMYKLHGDWTGADDLLPSEVCHHNMWFCMMEEPYGLSVRDDIGVDRFFWECDYPHANCPWPNTQERVSELFDGAHLSLSEIDRITHKNAEAIFNWTCVRPEELLARL